MFKAIELGGSAAGGFTGMFLAALGCEVTRVVAPDEVDEGTRARYRRAYLDRDKHVVQLDLGTPPDLERLRDELATADVLIDTLPPDGLAERGLGFEELHRRNPDLVVVSITPFGQDGPRAHWAATDLIVQAMGGLLASSGDSRQAPAKLAGEQTAHVPGVLATVQALAAVRGARSGTMPGMHIDVSMQEVMSTAWAREIGRYVYTGEGLARAGRLGLQGYPHTARCADGYVFLLALGGTWEGMATLLGLEDFLSEEWSDTRTRVQRWDEVEPHFNEALMARGRYEWFAAAAERGYTFAPIEDARSVLESPQLRSRQFFETIEVDGREVEVPSLPFTFATLEHPRSAVGNEGVE